MSYDVWMDIDVGGPEPVTVFDGLNCTCNVAPMWTKALGFSLRELQNKPAGECIEHLERAVAHMSHPDNYAEYQAMNPSNGWGDHEGATEFLEQILERCRKYPKCIVRMSY